MPKGSAQWGELRVTREWERGRGLAPENDTGKDVVRSGFEPCLPAVLRLSVRRAPDAGASWRFQGALARTGHLARAAERAFTISDELKQSEELLALVKAAADAGDLRGAQALAESVPVRQLQDQALVALVPAWARAGERDRGAALAERIRYPHHWGRAWAMLAKVVADNGDTHEALGFATRADEMSSGVFAGEWTAHVLALLVEVAAATGDQARAAALADRVEDFARSGAQHGRGHALDWGRPGPLAAVLACEALGGDLDRIDALLRRSPRTPLDAVVMADVLDAVPETADHDVALALADRATTLLDTDDGRHQDVLLRAVTLLLAGRGQAERAMALADWIGAPDLRAVRWAEIVRELARHGDTGRAEALAHTITHRPAQARALIDVVRELARHGDTDRAEALAHTITDRWAQGEALVAVVQELARRGDLGRAEALAPSIAYRATRARALVALAELSEPSHARRLAAQAVILDGWYTVLPVLERIAPRSVATLVDQMTS